MIDFTIQGHPPSPNVTRAGHWRQRAESDLTWRTAAYFATLDAIGRDRSHYDADNPAEVQVIFICPDHRRRDPDNAIAAAKPCIDGIVDSGVLADDSFDVIHSLVISRQFGKQKAIRFVITGDRP